MRKITDKLISDFRENLINEEKSCATIEKYCRDIFKFKLWIGSYDIEKAQVLKYKQFLVENYAPASVNSIISSLNSFFEFAKWSECRVKNLKLQRKIFSNKEIELTRAEYERLLIAAKMKKNQRLYHLLQTICSTGIRVSELKFVTYEAIRCGRATINCKGKMRIIILPKQLCKILSKYANMCNIKGGPIFVSRSGRPLDRSNIWSEMKKLCKTAMVAREKVFPHNLRHLFARTYYSLEKDVIRLADILGHSNVNTTRIYTMETGENLRIQIQKLGLLGHQKTT